MFRMIGYIAFNVVMTIICMLVFFGIQSLGGFYEAPLELRVMLFVPIVIIFTSIILFFNKGFKITNYIPGPLVYFSWIGVICIIIIMIITWSS